MIRMLIVAMVLAVASGQAVAAPVGIFTRVDGVVQIKADGSDDWQPAAKGTEVSDDCMVVAAAGTGEIVFFDGGNKLELLPKSALKIKADAGGFQGKKELELKLGAVVVTAMGGGANPVFIKSKAAEIEAKKAVFIAAVTEKGNTRVTGLDGRASVKNPKFGDTGTAAMGKEVISDAQGILQGATDKARLDGLLALRSDAGKVQGNKKIVLTFTGDGKEPRNIEIMLKERK